MIFEASEDEYKPTPGFKKDTRDGVDISSADPKFELWLMQCPVNQSNLNDFKGKKFFCHELDDEMLGTFESASGRSYDLVSFASQKPQATTFMPPLDLQVVGNFSRRVCLVHYPEVETTKRPGLSYASRNIQGVSRSSRQEISGYSTPSTKQSHGSARRSQSSHQKSSVVDLPASESPKESNRKHKHSPSVSGRSVDHSTRDSGREGLSSISSMGGFSEGGKSDQGKSKKKKIKMEE